MTTAQQLADRLNGIAYRDRIAEADLEAAKANNLVIVTGESDDLIEFEGAIYDEVGAYNGGDVPLDSNGIIMECDSPCDHCNQNTEREMADQRIKAQWSVEGYSWYITAENIESAAYFDVLEDGEKFCRGVVFSKGDLK